MQITGGGAIVNALAAAGVRVVFGIPGIHNLALFDALYQHLTIRHITVRHEQGGGFMADGYARASGHVGVVLTTTGPGATNALTPLMEAHADGSPLLLITTGLDDDVVGREVGELHEMRDQFATLQSVTGRGVRVKTVAEIPGALARILKEMTAGRRRPHLLEVPIEVCKRTERVEEWKNGRTDEAVKLPLLHSSTLPLDHVVDLIRNASRPLIIAGGGTLDAGAEVVALAEQLEAAVAVTRSSRGVVPDDHPLCYGMMGDEPFKNYLATCDLVIAVGTRFGKFWIPGNWPMPKLVHIDLDADVIQRRYPAEVGMVADAQMALVSLIEALGDWRHQDECVRERMAELRAERRAAQVKREPRTIEIVDALERALPRNAIVTHDMTLVCYSAIRLLPVFEPRTCFYPSYGGTLGFSPPAAIGAKLARPERPVVSLCGDGGFLFTMQELATASQENIAVTFVVFNDNCYSAIRRAERRMFGERFIGADLKSPDYARLAESFDIRAIRATNPEALTRAMHEAIDSDSPRLIEMKIDPPLADQ